MLPACLAVSPAMRKEYYMLVQGTMLLRSARIVEDVGMLFYRSICRRCHGHCAIFHAFGLPVDDATPSQTCNIMARIRSPAKWRVYRRFISPIPSPSAQDFCRFVETSCLAAACRDERL